MSEHTKEPWGVGEHIGNIVISPTPEERTQRLQKRDFPIHCVRIADCKNDNYLTYEQQCANARRIVACVNACQGLSDDDLQSLKLLAGSDVHAIRRERDKWKELSECLDRLLAYYRVGGSIDRMDGLLDRIAELREALIETEKP